MKPRLAEKITSSMLTEIFCERKRSKTIMKKGNQLRKELIVKKSITLNANISKVWEALTNPQLTKQYMYNCEVISDWKVGSPLVWKGTEDGKVYVRGNIVSIDPGRRLQFTAFDPNSEMEDTPSNY